jgi:pimeloyl-ACP methyl ester carboxylesterase
MPGNPADAPAPDTVVLIHGLWMTPLSWEHWIERYSRRGYRVLAPAWPGIEGDIETVRRDPSAYERLGVTEIADHYDRTIRRLDRPPIIMGHSFGGLITQILLDRGLGAAGVAIDPAPIRGILALPLSAIRVAWAALRNPANNHRSVALTPQQFHYAFTNTLSDRESTPVFERYAVPGPGRPLFQAAFANFTPRAATRVNVRNSDRAPLLLIAGGRDHTVPASVTRSNFRLYRHSKAITEYQEFPERSHFTLGEDGWEEVADYALNWAVTNAATRARAEAAVAAPRRDVPSREPDGAGRAEFR